MKIIGFYLFLFCFANLSWATMRPFQTARLHSSAGTGVASILLPESAILNPSTLVYFAESHVSYHQNQPKFKNENDDRESDNLNLPGNTRHSGLFVYDNSGESKGGIAHIQQKENNVDRKRTIGTLAGAMGSKMSMGFSYRYTFDKLTHKEKPRHQIHHQSVFGLTYIHSSEVTFGAVVEDPFLAIKEETKAMLGVQYAITPDLMAMGDYGGNYAHQFSKNKIWRLALQFNLFSDFFIRGGKFVDTTLDLEGSAWGVSWVSPKLIVDFGTKTSKNMSNKVSYLYPKERIIDTALSLGVRF